MLWQPVMYDIYFTEGMAIPEGFAPTFLDKPSIIPNETGTMITMKVSLLPA